MDLDNPNNVTYIQFPRRTSQLTDCLFDDTLMDLHVICDLLETHNTADSLRVDTEDQFRLVELADLCEAYLTEFERLNGDQHWNEMPEIELTLEGDNDSE